MITSTCNICKIISGTLNILFFLALNIWNLVYYFTAHFKLDIHIPWAQEPHVANGSFIGQCSSRKFLTTFGPLWQSGKANGLLLRTSRRQNAWDYNRNQLFWNTVIKLFQKPQNCGFVDTHFFTYTLNTLKNITQR